MWGAREVSSGEGTAQLGDMELPNMSVGAGTLQARLRISTLLPGSKHVQFMYEGN